jgi:hypothetical protein
MFSTTVVLNLCQARNDSGSLTPSFTGLVTLVDAGLVGGLSQSVFGLDQLPQPPEQAIGDHPYAPA